jgi:hypothetical protein
VIPATSNAPADSVTDQPPIPAVAQTLTKLFVEPVNPMRMAYEILESAKESAQGREGGLRESGNLRADLVLLGFKKEVVAGFLTNLAKMCALSGVPSGTLDRLQAVEYGMQLIENTLNEIMKARPHLVLLEIPADVSDLHRQTIYQAWLRIMRAAQNSVQGCHHRSSHPSLGSAALY